MQRGETSEKCKRCISDAAKVKNAFGCKTSYKIWDGATKKVWSNPAILIR